MRRHRPEAAERGIGWIGGFEKILSVGVYPDGIGLNRTFTPRSSAALQLLQSGQSLRALDFNRV